MPYIQNVAFQNEAGQALAGRLHLPRGPFRGAALFAHCFTCSKDITAARRIAESLSRAGLAVLRFDFTGLAQSEGDFARTSFLTNLADLRAAASFMASQSFGLHNLAPQILIGHSLGGAAVLAAAPGGLNTGPAPYDFLLAGLGACTAMTLTMYARRKGWPLEDVDVQLSHAKIHQQDTLATAQLDQMTRQITLSGPLDDAQRGQLMQIADKCPVHKTLEAGVQIKTLQGRTV